MPAVSTQGVGRGDDGPIAEHHEPPDRAPGDDRASDRPVDEDAPEDPFDDDLLEDGADEVLRLPVRPVVRLDDGTCFVNLPTAFRSFLAEAVEDLRHRIALGDESVHRLFPPAYLDNDDLDAEYQRLMRDELLRSRFGALDAVAESLDAEILDEEQATAWMQALNALRVSLGTELGVDDDHWTLPDDDPREGLYELYTYLGYMVGSIVEALSPR